ncbi:MULTISPECIES: SDR family NAD(P)-dependent oxidoreductase [unclassified Pseudoalteromonas]|uniref:SDR family NAD(P)-dependent oxidoreductase n=1 Tax=unclassified Pseudoalteromonas TaxID=194690 RepID=UPI000419903B|nr:MULTISPECIES: SDR family oxidoreductase [unclassified Pseudoalteromonas]MDC9496167.1 SDR family NAD(P)-dependent oxidoreductase [Pseudoalteromonas sp. Angola-20]MDC9515747.1 SDR family NAD(P)-dependent oxidoreductase [Pseudoalteromonas sp. Angola-22]MDC9532052.1 SDR family NAD(P)-dependent oxidoreductase [Pseudoalteromonas sp. Angola-9]TMP84694.1 short chain dehydrogenase [Pseudoalteromonas sp. S983]
MGFDKTLLVGKTILVTGAGKGIGKACVEKCVDAGAQVIAVARTLSDLQTLQQYAPEQIEIWPLDINSDAFFERLKALKTLDGLLNNAGINRVAPMLEQTDENIDDVIAMNIRSVYKISQAALPALINSGAGAVVNMSSQMGFVGSPKRTLYCMSKHAVEGLSKAMAVELANKNVRVNTVAPTFVETPMTKPMLEDATFKQFVYDMIPLKKIAQTDDIANACVFLLSGLSAMITGTSIKIDGGWTAQ